MITMGEGLVLTFLDVKSVGSLIILPFIAIIVKTWDINLHHSLFKGQVLHKMGLRVLGGHHLIHPNQPIHH